MLDGNASLWLHKLQNIGLIILSLVFLPLDTLILLLCTTWNALPSSTQHEKNDDAQSPKHIILVTGVGMTKGLVLARLFHQAGHKVIGADFEPGGALVCGRFSKAVHSFYSLSKPSPKAGSALYIQGLLDIITKHNVAAWVSCSGVASAVEDGEAKEIIEARTACEAVQFDVATTQLLHEKHSFIDHAATLGLRVPETHYITDKSDLTTILDTCPPGRKYILKTIDVVDAVRADMSLLPKPNPKETSRHIASLPISKAIPWILQEYIAGSEYCTHSLVVRGDVKAFVACPSAALLMHYEVLPADSALSQAMLAFTRRVAGHAGGSFTGHLSFDFLVSDGTPGEPEKSIKLYPIECNPRAHTAVALFNNQPALVDAYMFLLNHTHTHTTLKPHSNSSNPLGIVTPLQTHKYYWAGHDLVTHLLMPTAHVLLCRASPRSLVDAYRSFLVHLLIWKDGTFEVWDPLPWWWLYHVYWPMRFLDCIRQGTMWSQVNVSTTKIFEC